MADSGVIDGARLSALTQSGLLDSAAKDELQRLSRLATGLIGVPVSLVSLVSHDRQFFAAQTGLVEPWASARETPLSHSFCQHVVANDAPLVVENAHLHPLVRDNLAVRDLGVGAYAGVPVHNEAGETLGAFCAIDPEPRKWTPAELEVLVDLGALVTNAIELHARRQEANGRDPLTGLPSREVVRELAARAVRVAAADDAMTAAVAIGLDGFRLINDALGHAAGDAILKAVAGRLRESLRPGDSVCRLAGDVFLTVCERVDDEADALRIADRLRCIIADEPFVVADAVQPVAASVGVVTASTAVSADEFLAAAVAEMGHAKTVAQKRSGGNDPGDHQRAAGDRLRIRNAVAGAHRRGEMALVYQPLVRLGTERTVGYEALLRWEHPELGPIRPDLFIGAAEQSGAIVGIGEWVLEQACADVARWRRLAPWADLHVAVNVAPVQLGVPIFASQVHTILAEAGLEPSMLTLEVTERTLLADRPVHQTALADLRELGVRLALDDFGTGYSSLAYLTRFPFDDLKIDKAFVDRMAFDPQAASIVSGILGMARGLGLRTVAEGVETAEQAAALCRAGCELAQGYHYARPMPADDVVKQLRRH